MEDVETVSFFKRVWRGLRAVDRDDAYLAAATDPADLERRLRAIERDRGNPLFVTFNH